MSTESHTLYKDASPYYQGILATEGRYLAKDVVIAILHDHGFTEADYCEDIGGCIVDATDASDLLAWLGY